MVHIVLFSLSLVLVYFFIRRVYVIGIFPALREWFAHRSRIDRKLRRLLAAVAAFLLLAVVVQSLLYWLFAHAMLDSKDYVYLGNKSEYEAYFYDAEDEASRPVVSQGGDFQRLNHTFNGIYRSIPFFDDVEGVPGMLAKPFSIFGLLAFLSIIVFIAYLSVLGLYYGLYGPVIEHARRLGEFNGESENDFAVVARRVGLNKYVFAAMIFGSLLAFVIFTGLAGRMDIDDPAQSNPFLPERVRPGERLVGTPVNLYEEYSKSSSNSGSRPTGYWIVTFKVGGVFSPPVYISHYFDGQAHPQRLRTLQGRGTVGLRITEDLGVVPLIDSDAVPEAA